MRRLLFFALAGVFGLPGYAVTSVDSRFAFPTALVGVPSLLAEDASGRIVGAGTDFAPTVNGHVQHGLARFNADGSLDPTFDCGSGLSAGGSIEAVHLQSDGKILLLGSFTSFSGAACRGSVRLLANGAIDPAYTPVGTTERLVASAMDSRDRLYVVRNSVIERLNALGQVDLSLSALSGLPRLSTVFSLAVDANDRLLVMAEFRTVSAEPPAMVTAEMKIVRCRMDGSVDLIVPMTSRTFRDDIAYPPVVSAAQVMAASDGGFYATRVEQTGVHGNVLFSAATKYRADGTADSGFANSLYGWMTTNPSHGALYLFNAFPGGERYVSGSSNEPAPTGPYRLLPDGRIDPSFETQVTAFSSAIVLADGRLLVSSGANVVKYFYATGDESAPAALLANVSVRTTLAAGQTLIPGFVTNGTKNILIRAAGPRLNDFGLIGLPDPRLQAFNAVGGKTGENDDWESLLAPTFERLGAFPFLVGSKDSAALVTIAGPGSAFVSGAGAGTVLMELYDSDLNDHVHRLINVSARNRVGTGDDVLILGFVITGSGHKKLLIRGIGPTLGNFQVPGVLADPYLQVFDAWGNEIAANDDWDPALAGIFGQVGAFPLDPGSKDAALVITLPPGIYSVQVSPKNVPSGEGLVEIYEVAP